MAIAEQQPRLPELHRGQTHEAPSAVNELADKWGRLTTIATLAVLSDGADFSVGCYCADESRCHRSVLRELLQSHGAKISE